MTKKRKKKTATEKKMSPEKYIKTQARSLPIHECLINVGWKSSKMCSILITHKHSNGHLSWAVYLVDLLCLGVKDSFFTFNESVEEYKAFKEQYFPEDFFDTIDYTLAHNIIFAGYEFAAEFDLDPCKDFTQYTQYFLNEDNDQVELIEIECGKDDKPAIIAGKDNIEESQKLYTYLLNKVGKGNFIYEEVDDLLDSDLDDDFIDDLDGEYDEDEFDDEFEEEFDDEDEFEEDIPIEEYIYTQPLKERVEDVSRFKELVSAIDDKTNEDDAAELLYICNRLFYNYHTLEHIETSRNKWMNFLNVEVNDEIISPELKGTTINTHNDFVEEILDDLAFDEAFSNHNFKKLARQHPDLPFLSYLEVQQMNIKDIDQKKIEKCLNNALSIYPNYMLLKLEQDKYLAYNKKDCQVFNDQLLNQSSLLKLYKNRSSIHPLEFHSYINALEAYLISKEDIVALDSVLYSLKVLFPGLEESMEVNELFSAILKMDFCKKIYG